MGRAKEMMIEMEQDPFFGVSTKLVSAHLFENKLIRDFVLKKGVDGVCSYCGDMTKVLPLKAIVQEIDGIILQYFGEPDNEGVGWDSGFEDDAPGFHSEGGGYIVPNNKPYYDDMHELLLWTGFEVKDDDLEHDISNALSYHFSLIEKDPYGLNGAEERILDWRYITSTAMRMAVAGYSLNDMVNAEAARLDYLKQDIYVAEYPLQVKKDLTLFRAVNYGEALNSVVYSRLTSPPVEYTKDLRMSTKGDSVFYGSENKETTKREALSEEGEQYTYIGKFRTKHPVRLLDLTGIPGRLTMYDQEQFLLLLFLRYFCNAISEYVPDHETIKYVPTQLLTFYFRHHLRHYEHDGSSHPIDGIQYTSSKDGSVNTVLFFDNNSSAEHLELLEWECVYQGAVIERNLIDTN